MSCRAARPWTHERWSSSKTRAYSAMSRGWVMFRLSLTVSTLTRESSNIQKLPWVRLCPDG
jgi:hypothetical protein